MIEEDRQRDAAESGSVGTAAKSRFVFEVTRWGFRKKQSSIWDIPDMEIIKSMIALSGIDKSTGCYLAKAHLF